ncbi:MAG TPA: flagellar motor switch protein FliG, partial [Chloroflexota bacterium]
MAKEGPPLTGREKAAALLITLGGELSGDVAKHLSGQFLDQVTAQIAVTQDVAPEEAGKVVNEAWSLSQARQLVAEGGLAYARDMLARAFGAGSVEELLRRARAVREPFDFLRDTDPGYLINFLRAEHPQTVALILAHLNPKMTADLLARLPNTLRAEVARRMATMDRTSPDVVQELEELLRSKLATVIEQGTSNVGGVDYVVRV